MSMSRAMFSGVSGLQAHQTAMDVIGNNVANVSTNGFKSSRTVYRDMLYSSVQGASASTNNMGGNNPSQVGAGSQVSSIDVINTNGGRVTTNRSLDAYIDGEGYYAVATGNGETMYSRLGAFSFDDDGNLVDGNKHFVMGYLPKQPELLSYVDGVKVSYGSNGKNDALDGYTIKVNYVKNGTTGEYPLTIADADKKTITITAKLDTDGKETLTRSQLQDALKQLKTGLPTDITANKSTTWPNGAPIVKTTDKDNKVTESIITLDDASIKVEDADTNTTDIIATGSSKISETTLCDTSDPDALKKINYSAMDSVKNLSIGADGTITGLDSTSGKIVTIGQVAIATFANPNGLTEMGNSYYAVSSNSGSASYNTAGGGAAGSLVSSALEGSNVDLANEFSNMILTQRGFQANSKIITVSDTMLEELINLKR